MPQKCPQITHNSGLTSGLWCAWKVQSSCVCGSKKRTVWTFKLWWLGCFKSIIPQHNNCLKTVEYQRVSKYPTVQQLLRSAWGGIFRISVFCNWIGPNLQLHMQCSANSVRRAVKVALTIQTVHAADEGQPPCWLNLWSCHETQMCQLIVMFGFSSGSACSAGVGNILCRLQYFTYPSRKLGCVKTERGPYLDQIN